MGDKRDKSESGQGAGQRGSVLRVTVSSSELGKVMALNMSAGGIFLKSNEPDPVGAIVDLVFTHDRDGRDFHMQGKVARQITAEKAAIRGGRPGIAVKFIPLPDAEHRRVMSYLRGVDSEGAEAQSEVGLSDPETPSRRPTFTKRLKEVAVEGEDGTDAGKAEIPEIAASVAEDGADKTEAARQEEPELFKEPAAPATERHKKAKKKRHLNEPSFRVSHPQIPIDVEGHSSTLSRAVFALGIVSLVLFFLPWISIERDRVPFLRQRGIEAIAGRVSDPDRKPISADRKAISHAAPAWWLGLAVVGLLIAIVGGMRYSLGLRKMRWACLAGTLLAAGALSAAPLLGFPVRSMVHAPRFRAVGYQDALRAEAERQPSASLQIVPPDPRYAVLISWPFYMILGFVGLQLIVSVALVVSTKERSMYANPFPY